MAYMRTMTGGSNMSKLIWVAVCFVLVALFSGCATVSKEVTGPGGYKYKEQITASGKSNIDAATQTFGGKLKVESPDGLKVEAELDSGADAQGVKSENMTAEVIASVLFEIIKAMSAAQTPAP